MGLAVCSLLETSVSVDYMDYVLRGDGYTRVTFAGHNVNQLMKTIQLFIV